MERVARVHDDPRHQHHLVSTVGSELSHETIGKITDAEAALEELEALQANELGLLALTNLRQAPRLGAGDTIPADSTAVEADTPGNAIASIAAKP